MTGRPTEEDDVRRIHRLLADARAVVGQGEVYLRCDAELLETVYIEAEQDVVVVSDRGETFLYIDRQPDSTYRSWDEGVAAEACARHDVVLVTMDDEDGAGAVIERRVELGESVAPVVEAISRCIEESSEITRRATDGPPSSNRPFGKYRPSSVWEARAGPALLARAPKGRLPDLELYACETPRPSG